MYEVVLLKELLKILQRLPNQDLSLLTTGVRYHRIYSKMFLLWELLKKFLEGTFLGRGFLTVEINVELKEEAELEDEFIEVERVEDFFTGTGTSKSVDKDDFTFEETRYGCKAFLPRRRAKSDLRDESMVGFKVVL